MKLYARMAKFYGFPHDQMDRMHFRTFFGYVREANIMVEQEKAEYERTRHQTHAHNTLSPQEAHDFLTREFATAPYDGEVVPYDGR
jgi:hypothetical protein